MTKATPTLYEWAGGDEALRQLINAFYDRVERDELLSPFFPGGVSEDHRAHVTAWWSQVLGSPARHSEELGGYESMLAHHRGLAITTEQRFRFASLLSLAADDAGLPEGPEFRSALLAYVEWGTRLAMHNSQPGAEVVEHAPVPRWGWGRGAPSSRRSRSQPSLASEPSAYPPRTPRSTRERKQRRSTKPHSGYSSFRQERGSSGCGFGVLSSSMLKNGTTNGSGACTV